jgi:ubiquinone/menaquinone biosynthesis C-methylase UbiE
MKNRGVSTIPVERNDDVRKYFDSIAHEYSDQHGNPDQLLKYRTGILKNEALIRESDVILELCCGTGDHILALAEFSGRGVGIDFSPEMVKVANKRILQKELQNKIVCQVDNAVKLDSLKNESFDKAVCVGSLEHIPDKASVIEAVFRVLKPSGRFVCLTVNGDYVWYTKIAPLLNYNTHHFTSDNFLKRRDIETLLGSSFFITEKIGYWSFVPRGDMPYGIGVIFKFLDLMGRFLKIGQLRGGIFFTLRKSK